MLLFDENLAARLVADLADLYPGCFHVGDRPSGWFRSCDLAVCPRTWAYHRNQGWRLSAAQCPLRAPPKVIWIRLGNCSTADIIRLLGERHREIHRFVADEEAAFLALAW